MELDITNLISSDTGSELSGRAQNSNDNSASTPKIKRSYFKELERGPAKELPKLDKEFNLEQAMKQAYSKALDFANNVLVDDNMSMNLNEANEQTTIIVKDIEKNEVVQQYDPLQILQMYSSNYNLQGVVVDAII